MPAKFELDEMVFPQPQGNVRGFLIAMVTYSDGKSKRLAHSHLLVDETSPVSVEMPKKISAADIAVVTEAFTAFNARLTELVAQ